MKRIISKKFLKLFFSITGIVITVILLPLLIYIFIEPLVDPIRDKVKKKAFKCETSLPTKSIESDKRIYHEKDIRDLIKSEKDLSKLIKTLLKIKDLNIIKDNINKVIKTEKEISNYLKKRSKQIFKKLFVKKQYNTLYRLINLNIFKNYPEGLYYMGKLHYEGLGITKNKEKGIEYYKLASTLNHPESTYILAKIYEPISYKTYKEYLEKASKLKHPIALYKTGIYTDNKILLEESAKLKYPEAIFYLGTRYYDGSKSLGIKKDRFKSIKLLTEGSSLNHLESIRRLAKIYYFKLRNYRYQKNTKKTLLETEKLYEKLLKISLREKKPVHYTINRLLFLYDIHLKRNISTPELMLYKTIEKDTSNTYPKKLYKLLLIGNKQNHAPCIYELASIYKLGDTSIGIKKDLTKAINLYKKAVKLNHIESILSLAKIYEKTNQSESVKLYIKGCDLKSSEAMYRLAHYYENGIYFERDTKKAIDLYKKSAELGCLDANVDLSFLYYKGRYVKKDLKRGFTYFKKWTIPMVSISEKEKIKEFIKWAVNYKR